MYDYNWGYTIAQIQLLSIDQPIVVYHHDKKNKDGKKEFKKVNAVDVLKAQLKWEQNNANREEGKPIVLDFSNFGKNTKQ